MIQHYSGRLGTFDYDDSMFFIGKSCEGEDQIHIKEYNLWVNNYTVNMPKGLLSCEDLFYLAESDGGWHFPKSLTVIFDKDTVLNDCTHMFKFCRFDEDLNIIDLNIGEVACTDGMFSGIDISGTVNINTTLQCYLGECMFTSCDLSKFNINIQATGVEVSVFEDAIICEDFFQKFDFSKCNFINGYELFKGSTFNHSMVKVDLYSQSINRMFYEATLPKMYASICVNALESCHPTVYSWDGMFIKAKLPKFLDLDIEIESGEIPDLDEVIGRYDLFKFAYMFSGCSPQYIHFSERMFTQRDLYYTGMFEECNLPDYITETKPIAIMRQFNEVYDKAIVSYNSDYESCKHALIELLKSGKSREYIIGYLKEQYRSIDVDSIYVEFNSKLSTECSKNVSSLLEIPVGSEYCRYTISEVRNKLREAGYPKKIVDDCILNYIGDQYISL